MVDCTVQNLIQRGRPQHTLPTQVFVGSGMFQRYEDYDRVSNTLSSMSRTCNSFPALTDKNVTLQGDSVFKEKTNSQDLTKRQWEYRPL
jgi:hypothetical protein